MKSILKLYQIFLVDFKRDNYFNWICNRIEYHHSFTDKEKERLLAHFRLQKPSETKYVEFFNDKRFKKRTTEWWGRNEKKARIEFLETIIKKLEEKVVQTK